MSLNTTYREDVICTSRKDENMNLPDALATGAMLLIVLITLVLLMHYLKLRDIWALLSNCQKSLRWARIQESENRELRSALRAEKAHVEQLRRNLVLLQPTSDSVEKEFP
jgi:predicted metalloprotease